MASSESELDEIPDKNLNNDSKYIQRHKKLNRIRKAVGNMKVEREESQSEIWKLKKKTLSNKKELRVVSSIEQIKERTEYQLENKVEEQEQSNKDTNKIVSSYRENSQRSTA